MAAVKLNQPDKQRQLDILKRNIQRLADERGMTQAELARASGVKRNLINTYWHGTAMPGKRAMQAIAAAMRTTPNAIVPDYSILEGDGAEQEDEPEIMRTEAVAPGQTRLELKRVIPTKVALQILALVWEANGTADADGDRGAAAVLDFKGKAAAPQGPLALSSESSGSDR